jgi:DeoR-like helix-turn-helix domain
VRLWSSFCAQVLVRLEAWRVGYAMNDYAQPSQAVNHEQLHQRATGEYIRAVLNGGPPNGTPPGAFGPFQHLVAQLVMAHALADTPGVRQAWHDAVRNQPELAGLVASDIAAPTPLDELLAAFHRWLFLPDPGLIYALLGTVAANRMAGDPVWLMLVGASSSGKTEGLLSLARLPHVHIRSVITESGLLSGTPTKEKAADARGGLLREIGEFGYLILKDFTSILSMHRDARAAILAALREIYDGHWSRNLGVDGGRTLTWRGKLALLAGCTATIDTHHAVIGTMGERFVFYRLPQLTAEQEQEQARRALATTGQEAIMRAELASAVETLFSTLELPQAPPCVSDAEQTQLITLATLAARCRSPVEREGYSHEIQLIPPGEAPSRLVRILVRLFTGMMAVGISRDRAWHALVKVALDCMPALRRAVLEQLLHAEGPLETTTLAAQLGYPTQTTRRSLEDLAAHHVVTRHPAGKGKADRWALSEWARQQYQAVTEGVPQMSEPMGA